MARDIIFDQTELVPIQIEIERYGAEDFTVRKSENGVQVNHVNFYLPRNVGEEEWEYIDRVIEGGLAAV